MNANCNISSVILKELKKLKFGINCKVDQKDIIIGYLQYIGCTNIVFCSDNEDCNTTVEGSCNFTVPNITYTNYIDTSGKYIIEATVDLSEFLSPELMIFNWSINSDSLEIIEAIGNTVKLGIKNTITSGNLEGQLTVLGTDEGGCVDDNQTTIVQEIELWEWEDGNIMTFDTNEPILINN